MDAPMDTDTEDSALHDAAQEAAPSPDTASPPGGTAGDERNGKPKAARFEEIDDAGGEPSGEDINMDVILDIQVTLSLEVGRTRIPIRNLLQLNHGSVVELDREAGKPLDVFVNGTLVAHGEVVVVNDRFGVRLLDVVSPAERVRLLK